MIRAIIFDFGNVICSFDIQIFLKKVLPFTDKSMGDLQRILHQSVDLATAYETGLVTSEHFFNKITGRCNLSLTKHEFVRAYCDIFSPIPTTVDLIRALRPKYKLGLLSNTSEWHFEYGIKPMEVFDCFDTITLSFEVKAMKPAKEIYLDTLRKLRVTPEETIYIDDIKENAEAAGKLGMQAIHYTSHRGLLKAMRHLVVEC